MTEIRHPSTNPIINYLRDTVGRYFQRLLPFTCAVSVTLFTRSCRLLVFPSPIVSCLVPSIMQFVGRIVNGPAGFLQHRGVAVECGKVNTTELIHPSTTTVRVDTTVIIRST